MGQYNVILMLYVYDVIFLNIFVGRPFTYLADVASVLFLRTCLSLESTN